MNPLAFPLTACDAWRGAAVRFGDAVVQVPGTRRIRLSVVASNRRIHRPFDRSVSSGGTVVDVGANIGYNALDAARLVGPTGRVIAVNSFYADSCYAEVTDVVRVPVLRLDDIVAGEADVVKIDVEGAEFDVLAGMQWLMAVPWLVLIIEWRPRLQRLAVAEIARLAGGWNARPAPSNSWHRGRRNGEGGGRSGVSVRTPLALPLRIRCAAALALRTGLRANGRPDAVAIPRPLRA